MELGSVVSDDLMLSSLDYDPTSLGELLFGAEALVLCFLPITYGLGMLEVSDAATLQMFLRNVDSRAGDLVDVDIRFVCVTRESADTARHWLNESGIGLEMYRDGTLEVSRALLGTCNLSAILKTTLGVTLPHIEVPLPGLVVISADGTLASRYVAASVDYFTLTVDQVIDMALNSSSTQ